MAIADGFTNTVAQVVPASTDVNNEAAEHKVQAPAAVFAAD